MNRFVAFVAGVASLVASSGCGSTVAVHDDGTGGSGGGACCAMAPTCPADSREVESCETAHCFEVEACCSQVLCEPAEQCFGAPTCEAYEIEVDACPGGWMCREVTMCGLTILCGQEVFCDGYPSCDPGDTEYATCPFDVPCYAAEMCGTTIICADTALPQHGCPDFAPSNGQACEQIATSCDYETGNGCFEAYVCARGMWQFIGGGCEG